MKLQRPDPGIDAAKSGLHGKAGIFFNAGLLEKGEPRFDLQDLDPYLVFDSRESMLGTLEAETLDLDPATPSTLDVITATRAGVATFTEPDGTIASAPANTVRVDYTQGEQLTPTKFQRVGYSTPDSNWATVNSTLVENFDAAPDGTQSASKATKLAVGGSSSSNDRVKYSSIAITNGTTYSVSVHLKNIDVAGFTTIAARVSGGSLFRVKFIWNTSTLSSDSGTTSNRLVEDLGDGWYRVSFSFESNGAAATLEIDIDRSTGGREDTSSILVWGAQLEEGTTATTFVANTTGSPKFITGATFGPRVPMILVEPSATNLFTYSEDATQWTGSNRTVTPNTTTAPDGNQTAATIVRTAGSGDVRGTIQSVSAGLDYSLSIFAKADTDALIKLDVSNGVFGTGDVTFNARTGEQTAGDTTKASVEVFPNGWRRFVFTPTCTVTGTSSTIIRLENDEPVQLWGFQFEEGLVTSYIPTSGSTVTRAADDLVISGSAFTDFYNQSEGTFYMEVIDKNNLDSISHLYLTGGGQKLLLYSNGVSSNVANYDGANFLQFTGIPSNELIRMAISYKPSSKKLSVNGNTTSDSPYNGNFSGTYSVNLGVNLLGHIKRLIYWPTHSDSL